MSVENKKRGPPSSPWASSGDNVSMERHQRRTSVVTVGVVGRQREHGTSSAKVSAPSSFCLADDSPPAVGWVEANIYESLSFYRFPESHRKHIKSTNMVERLNEEIKRRTLVVRIFPNQESALRLIRALAVEMHEDWIEEHRYLNMEELSAGRRWTEGAQAS